MSKILGNLVGAAMGDAMGAATEMRSRRQIEEKFGGYVREFLTPPDDTFARGNKAGMVTDDFSLAYETCLEIIENEGKIDEETANKALLRWAREDNYFKRFAGPTTKAAIAKLKGETLQRLEMFEPVNNNFQATNGSAMKISPISLFAAGDIEKSIEQAVKIVSVSHPNNISISAACAVAAATNCAMDKNASLYDILRAGIYGAKEGDRIGRKKYKTLAGASVEKRIALAIELANRAENMVDTIDSIADLIGSGLMAAEAVPAVFGIIAASKGDVFEGIYAGVNIGHDTDTVATMVGGILGTYCGSEVFDEGIIELLESVNGFELRKMAQDIQANIIRRGMI